MILVRDLSVGTVMVIAIAVGVIVLRRLYAFILIGTGRARPLTQLNFQTLIEQSYAIEYFYCVITRLRMLVDNQANQMAVPVLFSYYVFDRPCLFD